tara:strand:- start:66 stop:1424 length:1359 start_codon:yes stop_codon:yes gene_type:complete
MTHYAGHRASPPAGYSTWEEFYRERAANPQMFGDGTSIGPSYPDRFTEEFVNSPFIRLLAPWAKTALMSKGTPLQKNPSPVDYALSAVDVALPAIPVGLIAGRVKDVAKEPLTNIGQWVIKWLREGKTSKQIRKLARDKDLPGSPVGQSVGNDTITLARVAEREGRGGTFRISKKGGGSNIPVAEGIFPGTGFQANIPLQRDFLRTYKTRSYPDGFPVDDMTDHQIKGRVKKIRDYQKAPNISNRHMAPIGKAEELLGGKGLNITTNPDLQKAVADMDIATLERYVNSTVHDYLFRHRISSKSLSTAKLNELRDIVRNNLLLRRERLQGAKPLWQLNEPQLVIQTHHGKPTAERIGGSVTDPRNIWGVSGSAVQGGTHGLAHRLKSEVEPFYSSLRTGYYNPFYESVLKTSKMKAEPYAGWLDEMQELDPSLWDYNMRRAYEMFRNKKNIWN